MNRRTPATLVVVALVSAVVGVAFGRQLSGASQESTPIQQEIQAQSTPAAAPSMPASHQHAAAPAGGSCWPSGTPQGALPPAVPSWCVTLDRGASTFVQGANAWLDEFDHGLTNADLGDGYRAFDGIGSLNQVKHFRHANHWMADVNGRDQDGPGPWNLGGTTMRPDRSFRFVDGRLVIEADVAAGIAEYRGNAWPELVVTTAPAPTVTRRDGIYNYDVFAGHQTVGCRLGVESQGGSGGIVPICAMFDSSSRGPGEGGRVWEVSYFQGGDSSWGKGAAQKWGGHPSIGGLTGAGRICRGTDPDTDCRDHFRWELSKDRSAIYINGTLYMEHAGFPAAQQLPERFLESDVYVYFGSWTHKPDVDTVRFHWDRLAVNPEASDLQVQQAEKNSAAVVSGAAATPTPAPAPRAAASEALQSSTSPGTQVVIFDDRAGESQPLNGVYPSAAIDWGNGDWWHAGPFGRFTGKSISFNGAGLTRASFTFLASRRLVKLEAHNGGNVDSTVTLSCGGQPAKEATVTAGSVLTIETGWTAPCATVTLTSSNGWNTNFDNLTHDGG